VPDTTAGAQVFVDGNPCFLLSLANGQPHPTLAGSDTSSANAVASYGGAKSEPVTCTLQGVWTPPP
jgi:hypothetical protein